MWRRERLLVETEALKWSSEGFCSDMFQYEGNLMKLAGCPLEEVQWTLLQYSLQSFFKHRYYTPGFVQGVAIGYNCRYFFYLHKYSITE